MDQQTMSKVIITNTNTHTERRGRMDRTPAEAGEIREIPRSDLGPETGYPD
jgi:hypothetical protein